jgi:hypothetical protein
MHAYPLCQCEQPARRGGFAGAGPPELWPRVLCFALHCHGEQRQAAEDDGDRRVPSASGGSCSLSQLAGRPASPTPTFDRPAIMALAFGSGATPRPRARGGDCRLAPYRREHPSTVPRRAPIGHRSASALTTPTQRSSTPFGYPGTVSRALFPTRFAAASGMPQR